MVANDPPDNTGRTKKVASDIDLEAYFNTADELKYNTRESNCKDSSFQTAEKKTSPTVRPTSEETDFLNIKREQQFC